jgi:hypothetical protein
MWWGLALQGAGQGAEAYGNAQGTKAIERAWRNALERQDRFDSQANARTLSFLDSLSPDVIAGTQQTNEVANRLNASSTAVGKAIKAKAAKGGRNALPPGGAQRLADALREQQAVDEIVARRGGFAAGMQDVSNAARDFQGDRGRIVRDAELWQTILPYVLRTAGTKGGTWRGIGQGMQIAGDAYTNWAMSQPKKGSDGPYDKSKTDPKDQAQLSSWNYGPIDAPSYAPMQAHQPGYAAPGTGVIGAGTSWTMPAQWQMGNSMAPSALDLWGSTPGVAAVVRENPTRGAQMAMGDSMRPTYLDLWGH